MPAPVWSAPGLVEDTAPQEIGRGWLNPDVEAVLMQGSIIAQNAGWWHELCFVPPTHVLLPTLTGSLKHLRLLLLSQVIRACVTNASYMQLQEEDHGEAVEAAEAADAAPAAESEADKEEWQQIEVPIEWQPRPMFKVNLMLSLLLLNMMVHGQTNNLFLLWASKCCCLIRSHLGKVLLSWHFISIAHA